MLPPRRIRPAVRQEDHSASEPEPHLPWSTADYRNRVMRLIRQAKPELLQELQTRSEGVAEAGLHTVAADLARAWRLDMPWIVALMRRTVRVWRRSPAMRKARQWAPVLPENGFGSRLRPSRRGVQHRGMKPLPGHKVQDVSHFGWWVRYHLLEEGFGAIAAADRVETAAVRMAATRIAKELQLPLRTGRRGRPRKLSP